MYKNLIGTKNIKLQHRLVTNKYFLLYENDLYGASIEKYYNVDGTETLMDFDTVFPFTESQLFAEKMLEKLLHCETFPEHLVDILDDSIE